MAATPGNKNAGLFTLLPSFPDLCDLKIRGPTSIVHSSLKEDFLKPRSTLIFLSGMFAVGASLAKDLDSAHSGASGLRLTPRQSDQILLSDANTSLRRMEASLSDYLVAFNSSQDGGRRRLGLPLASLGDSGFKVAYDLSGKSVMAQWTYSQVSPKGNSLNFQTYLGQSGGLNFVLRAVF